MVSPESDRTRKSVARTLTFPVTSSFGTRALDLRRPKDHGQVILSNPKRCLLICKVGYNNAYFIELLYRLNEVIFIFTEHSA